MAALIVYATKHGCTEQCSLRLKDLLPGQVDLKNLKDAGKVDIDPYDTILIGGSIHAGQIQKKVRVFCRDFAEKLKHKHLGLFLCCMKEKETAQEQFDSAFPEELRTYAEAHGLFGGAFDFQKMNFIERKLVNKIAGINSSISRISEKAIARFANDLGHQAEGWGPAPEAGERL